MMNNKKLIIRAQEIRKKPFHLSSNLRIIYVLKGSVDLEFVAGRYTIEEGDAEIININEPVGFADGTAGNLVLLFEFDGETAKKNQPYIDKALYNCGTTLFYPCTAKRKDREQLKSKLLLLYGLYMRTDDYSLIDKVTCEIEDLIVDKLNDFKNMLVDVGVSENNMSRLLRIYDLIYENAANKLNLKEIAEREYVSVQYLSKEFNEKLHINFKTTVEYYKVIQAVRYLVSTDMSITMVSENSGFSAPRFFYKQFSYWLKCTPLEFKNKILKDEERLLEFPPDAQLVRELIARMQTVTLGKIEESHVNVKKEKKKLQSDENAVDNMLKARELLEEACALNGKRPDAGLVFLTPDEVKDLLLLLGQDEARPLTLIISLSSLDKSPAELTFDIQDTMSYIRILRSIASEKGIQTAFDWKVSKMSERIDNLLGYEPTDVILGLLFFTFHTVE